MLISSKKLRFWGKTRTGVFYIYDRLHVNCNDFDTAIADALQFPGICGTVSDQMRYLIQPVAEKTLTGTDLGTVGDDDLGAAALRNHALVYCYLLHDGTGNTAKGTDTAGTKEALACRYFSGGAYRELAYKTLLVSVDFAAG